jgi:hypothetical protein
MGPAAAGVVVHPGTGVLRELVRVRMRGRKRGSELESDFFGILRRARLPLPVPQHPVRCPDRWRKIDFAYPDCMLAIEVDGYE